MKELIALVYFVASSSLAHADGTEDRYVSALKSHGFICTVTLKGDGIYCIQGKTYVLVPKNLSGHRYNLFYAHGDVGVCPIPISGENWLKDQMPALARKGAIAVLPYRPNPEDLSFPFGSLVAQVDQILGDPGLPWIMAGHSWGGKFFAKKLQDTPAVAQRTAEVLLLDGVFETNDNISDWLHILAANPQISLRAISSNASKGFTTAKHAAVLFDAAKKKFPGRMNLEIKGDQHCDMPKYFNEL